MGNRGSDRPHLQRGSGGNSAGRANPFQPCALWVLLILLGAGFAPGIALAEEVQSAEPQAVREVTFTAQGLPNKRSTDVRTIAERSVLRVFLQQNPGIKIEPFIIPTIQGVSLDAGPLMAIAAGIPPHAMHINFRQSATYLERNFLIPLEPLLARILSDNERVRMTDKDGKWLEDPTPEEIAHALKLIRERVPGPAWPVLYRPRVDGEEPHAWALPVNNIVMALLYRKDLFAAAGLPTERGPADWEEFLEYTRILTDPASRRYGFALHGQLAASTYSFLVSNGGKVVEEQPDGSWRAVWNSREAAEAYAFVWELVNGNRDAQGHHIPNIAVGGTDLELKWKRGEIAMRFNYLNERMLADINPQLVGIAPVPVGPRGSRASEVNAHMMGIFQECTPEQQLAVMKYIWFRTGDEAESISTKVLVDNGYGPFVNPELLKKFGYEDVLRQVPPGWQEAFETSMTHGVPEPYGRNTQNVYRYLSRPIATALERQDLLHMTQEQRINEIQKLLDASAEEFTVKVLGEIPPEEMRTRRIIAGFVLVLVAAAFIWGFVSVWRYFGKVSRSVHVGKPDIKKYMWGYVLIFPAMALIIGWSYLPLLGGAVMSVVDYELVSQSVFVGVDNFADALYDYRFWDGFAKTFYFVAMSIVLGFWPPILLAILLDEIPTETLKYFFRTVYYLPAIISGIIVIFLWKQLLEPFGIMNEVLLAMNNLSPFAATLIKLVVAGLWLSLVYTLITLPLRLWEMSLALRASLWLIAAGVIYGTLAPLFEGGFAISEVTNLLWGSFDVERTYFLLNPETAMIWCVVPSVWAGSGPGCLLYLAALKTVPEDLYESAAIDGAGAWQRVFYITLPRLKFLIVIQFIAAVVGAFKGGANFILAMTGGGPNDATMVLALEIFMKAFLELEFGYAAAMAWMLGAVLMWFTAYQLRMLSRAEFRAGATGGK